MPLRQFLRLLQEARPTQVAALFLLMLLASATEGFGILLLVPLLDLLQGDAGSSRWGQWLQQGLQEHGVSLTAGGLLGLFLVLVVVRNGVQHARELLAVRLQHRLVDRLRQRCFKTLLGAEWRWIARGRQSDHANLLLTDVNRVGSGLSFGFGLMAAAVTIAAYLAAALVLSWEMTLLALVSGALVFALLSGQRRRALQLGRDLGKANQSLHQTLHESLAGLKLVKILGNELSHLAMFRAVMRRVRAQQESFIASTSLSRALFQTGAAFLLALYLFVGLSYWQVPTTQLLVLVLLFSRLIPQFSTAQQYYHHWLHAIPALQETDRLLAENQAAAEPRNGREEPRLRRIREGICLERACVRYTGRETVALDAVSLCFPAGKTTAVVGTSGAGKSTLADALMGLVALDGGRLLVDGEPIEGSGRLSWRRSVAYVPQETFLFNDSIRNNLLWGSAEASDSELRTALHRAASEFVLDLPEQLDTIVGDGGVRLSGGERQRLALARALLKRPALLILDEATSALDPANEQRVRRAIENLHGDLTLVIIGHRPAMLERADQVLVLEAGRVLALGSWSDVRGSGEYGPCR